MSKNDNVPAMPKTADQLRRLTSAILEAGGSAGAEAHIVADHLVQANLAGHDSHGVGMVPAYVRHVKAGLVVPNTRAKVVKDDGPILMFDGQGTILYASPPFERVLGYAPEEAVGRNRLSFVEPDQR